MYAFYVLTKNKKYKKKLKQRLSPKIKVEKKDEYAYVYPGKI